MSIKHYAVLTSTSLSSIPNIDYEMTLSPRDVTRRSDADSPEDFASDVLEVFGISEFVANVEKVILPEMHIGKPVMMLVEGSLDLGIASIPFDAVFSIVAVSE